MTSLRKLGLVCNLSYVEPFFGGSIAQNPADLYLVLTWYSVLDHSFSPAGAKRPAKRKQSGPYDVQTSKRRRSSDSWTRASADDDHAYCGGSEVCTGPEGGYEKGGQGRVQYILVILNPRH